MIYRVMFNWIFTLSIYLISDERYNNAGVHCLKIRKSNEIWPSMKDSGEGLGVKNISDLVLREIYCIYG